MRKSPGCWTLTTPTWQLTTVVSPGHCRMVTVAGIRRLRPGIWLNDEVMNASTQLLIRRDDSDSLVEEGRLRSYCFSTHFMTALLTLDNAERSGTYNYQAVQTLDAITPPQCGHFCAALPLLPGECGTSSLGPRECPPAQQDHQIL